MEPMLNEKQVQNLFKKFFHPLVKSSITEHQKKISLGIAKTLWVALVGENDTEKQIYNLLNGKHEANIQIGSLYYYSIDENINNLENWLD
jgi:hypothetical protein